MAQQREYKFQSPWLIALATLLLTAVLTLVALWTSGALHSRGAQGRWEIEQIGPSQDGLVYLQQNHPEFVGELDNILPGLRQKSYFLLKEGGQYEAVFMQGSKQTGKWALEGGEVLLFYGLMDPNNQTTPDTLHIQDMGTDKVEMVYYFPLDGHKLPFEITLVRAPKPAADGAE